MPRVKHWRYLAVLGLAATLVNAGPREESSPLLNAAKSGDFAALSHLVEEDADVNITAEDGATPLHWVSYRDEVDAADLLIRAGTDVNAVNYVGVTPLWLASQNGSSAMVERLLKAGADPNPALPSGETPVMTAARSGAADAVEILLRHGADPNRTAHRGQTALMWAAAQKHSDVIEVLVKHGADVHARSEEWGQLWQTTQGAEVHPDNTLWVQHGGYTALLFAAQVGDLASVKALVAGGADPNDAAAYGVSATVLAAHSGDGELVGFLLDSGADPNADAAGYSALHAAILRRKPEVVAELLAHGADPHAPLRTGTPVRSYAGSAGERSFDVHFHPGWIGATPFWLAARFLQPDVMRLLVKNGADPLFVHDVSYWGGGNPSDGYRRVEEGATTALMAAMGMGAQMTAGGFVPPPDAEREALALDAARLLIELGIDPSSANSGGQTALDGAQGQGYKSVVEFLNSASTP